MIGDHVDALSTTASAPEIPLVVISNRVQSGEWRLVENVLTVLFSTAQPPHVAYDHMYEHQMEKGSSSIQIGGEWYTMERKPEYNERLVYCP